MRHSYRKTLLNFIAAALLPMILMGGIISQIVFRYVTQELRRANSGTLTQIVKSDSLMLDELDTIFLTLSTNSELAFNLAEILETGTADYHEALYYRTMKSFLSSHTYTREYIHSIYITMEDYPQRIFSSTDGVAISEDFYDIAGIKDVCFIPGQNYVLYSRCIPASDSTPETEVISICRKFMLGNSNHEAMIVLNLDKQYWDDMLCNTDVRGSSEMLAEHDGSVLFESCSDLEKKWGPHLAALDQYESDFFDYELDGERYMVSRSNLGQYNIRYYMFTKTHDLYQVLYTILKLIALCAVVLIVISLVILTFLSRKQYARVKHIVNLLRTESSIMKVPISQQDFDEFEYIAHSIQDNFLLQKYFETELKEKTYKQKYTELASLQAQINPHMLYNTLETIQWKAYSLTDGYNEVVMMLESLSSILKYSLNPATEMVSIGEEIDNTVNYIRLVKFRYADQFRVIWDYSEDVIQYKTMRLMLQPIIENAINHGARQNKQRMTYIKICISCVDEVIQVRILNTGAGMTAEQLEKVQETLNRDFAPAKGMGLYNINKRLQLQYGTHLTIHSKPEHGTVVSFHFPAQPYESEAFSDSN